MNDEHISAHMLLKVPGIGAQKMHSLLSNFQSYANVWKANVEELTRAGLSEKLASAIIKAQRNLSQEKENTLLKSNEILIVLHSDKDFPTALKRSTNQIPLLYIRGNLQILNQSSVAIVGSRKFSPYGKQVASRLSFDLAQAGIQIVSGLALGIDALAHKGALESVHQTRSSGKTIAVLAGGIDDATIAPRSHLVLAHDILTAGGALISAYPPLTIPNKGTFPARNAIMASLSDATLVIEAAQNSGTLLTANYACEFDKHLFAVPGSIFAPESVGTHELIASGKAKMTCQANDILKVLDIATPNTNKRDDNTTLTDPQHAKIFDALKENPTGLSIDKIIRLTKLEGSTVSQSLVMMEIDGIVMHLGGGLYSLK